jgi:uncharacterized membrane protein YeaQ/YmgE (transglycosylase-associated protein family)
MGGRAWIVPGRAASVMANMLIPGRRSQRLVITCAIGAAGELLGGRAATRLFLTVVAGVIVLPVCHPLTERSGHLAHR